MKYKKWRQSQSQSHTWEPRASKRDDCHTLGNLELQNVTTVTHLGASSFTTWRQSHAWELRASKRDDSHTLGNLELEKVTTVTYLGTSSFKTWRQSHTWEPRASKLHPTLVSVDFGGACCFVGMVFAKLAFFKIVVTFCKIVVTFSIVRSLKRNTELLWLLPFVVT